MIKRVVSHVWKRKGYSSLLLQLETPPDHEPHQVLLTLSGASEESTPYLVAVSAAMHPLQSNDDATALSDVLIEGLVLEATTTSVALELLPTHRYLRLDFIGRLHSTLAPIWSVGDHISRAAVAALAFDHVTHNVTVTLDYVVDNASQRGPMLRRSPSPQVVTGSRPEHGCRTTERGASQSTTSLEETLNALQDELAWYQQEDRRWQTDKLALLSELRGEALKTPRCVDALPDA